MTDSQNIAQLQKDVKALQNLVKYMTNDTRTVGGIAANQNRYTNDFINLFLPWLPLIARLDVPILVADGAVTSLTCFATNYNLDNNDKFVILNIETGNQFDLVASADTSAGGTSLSFDSFTPTEDLGCNCLILFKMARDTGAHFIKIDA